MGTLFIARDRIAYRKALKDFADALAPLIAEEAQRRTDYRLRLAAKLEELERTRRLKLEGSIDQFGSSPANSTDFAGDLLLSEPAESPRGSAGASTNRRIEYEWEDSPAPIVLPNATDLGSPWELVPNLLPTSSPTLCTPQEGPPDAPTSSALPDSTLPSAGMELSAIPAGPSVGPTVGPRNSHHEPNENGPDVAGSLRRPGVPDEGGLGDPQGAELGVSKPKA